MKCLDSSYRPVFVFKVHVHPSFSVKFQPNTSTLAFLLRSSGGCRRSAVFFRSHLSPPQRFPAPPPRGIPRCIRARYDTEPLQAKVLGVPRVPFPVGRGTMETSWKETLQTCLGWLHGGKGAASGLFSTLSRCPVSPQTISEFVFPFSLWTKLGSVFIITPREEHGWEINVLVNQQLCLLALRRFAFGRAAGCPRVLQARLVQTLRENHSLQCIKQEAFYKTQVAELHWPTDKKHLQPFTCHVCFSTKKG